VRPGTVREYTLLAALSVVLTVLAERWWLRTGLLSSRAYWIAMGICSAFMIAVNGWLTKLSAPIVLYNPHDATGWRVPWDIPVEDYFFGFSLLTLTMLLWDRGAKRVAR
jgi:lycopene cyclase domain-containing protein